MQRGASVAEQRVEQQYPKAHERLRQTKNATLRGQTKWRITMADDLILGEDGWTEIVGEQLRGGSTVAGDDAAHILGELVKRSPAFAAYASKRLAASRPMLSKTPLNKARDWQIDFGPVYGLAGSSTTITVNPQVLFRGEKVMATDSGATRGYGTRIAAIFVGQKSQRPANSGSTLTAMFAQNALGNGIKWDTCEKALSISVTINFQESCTFDMTVFGKAVLG